MLQTERPLPQRRTPTTGTMSAGAQLASYLSGFGTTQSFSAATATNTKGGGGMYTGSNNNTVHCEPVLLIGPPERFVAVTASAQPHTTYNTSTNAMTTTLSRASTAATVQRTTISSSKATSSPALPAHASSASQSQQANVLMSVAASEAIPRLPHDASFVASKRLAASGTVVVVAGDHSISCYFDNTAAMAMAGAPTSSAAIVETISLTGLSGTITALTLEALATDRDTLLGVVGLSNAKAVPFVVIGAGNRAYHPNTATNTCGSFASGFLKPRIALLPALDLSAATSKSVHDNESVVSVALGYDDAGMGGSGSNGGRSSSSQQQVEFIAAATHNTVVLFSCVSLFTRDNAEVMLKALFSTATSSSPNNYEDGSNNPHMSSQQMILAELPSLFTNKGFNVYKSAKVVRMQALSSVLSGGGNATSITQRRLRRVFLEDFLSATKSSSSSSDDSSDNCNNDSGGNAPKPAARIALLTHGGHTAAVTATIEPSSTQVDVVASAVLAVILADGTMRFIGRCVDASQWGWGAGASSAAGGVGGGDALMDRSVSMASPSGTTAHHRHSQNNNNANRTLLMASSPTTVPRAAGRRSSHQLNNNNSVTAMFGASATSITTATSHTGARRSTAASPLAAMRSKGMPIPTNSNTTMTLKRTMATYRIPLALREPEYQYLSLDEVVRLKHAKQPQSGVEQQHKGGEFSFVTSPNTLMMMSPSGSTIAGGGAVAADNNYNTAAPPQRSLWGKVAKSILLSPSGEGSASMLASPTASMSTLTAGSPLSSSVANVAQQVSRIVPNLSTKTLSGDLSEILARVGSAAPMPSDAAATKSTTTLLQQQQQLQSPAPPIAVHTVVSDADLFFNSYTGLIDAITVGADLLRAAATSSRSGGLAATATALSTLGYVNVTRSVVYGSVFRPTANDGAATATSAEEDDATHLPFHSHQPPQDVDVTLPTPPHGIVSHSTHYPRVGPSSAHRPDKRGLSIVRVVSLPSPPSSSPLLGSGDDEKDQLSPTTTSTCGSRDACLIACGHELFVSFVVGRDHAQLHDGSGKVTNTTSAANLAVGSPLARAATLHQSDTAAAAAPQMLMSPNSQQHMASQGASSSSPSAPSSLQHAYSFGGVIQDVHVLSVGPSNGNCNTAPQRSEITVLVTLGNSVQLLRLTV